MPERLQRVEILREFETPIRGPVGTQRFITIVGWLRDVPISGMDSRETYSCLVGPVLQEYEFLAATCLPSIASLSMRPAEIAQCTIESSEADWDRDSRRVELKFEMWAAGGTAKAQVLFSVTILASG